VAGVLFIVVVFSLLLVKKTKMESGMTFQEWATAYLWLCLSAASAK
jgi:hypothetical protein